MSAQNANLLVIDDEIPIRKMLCAILTQSGYKVRAAEDGFSALAEIRNEIPDMILSDLNMPGMSGFELLSVVRRRFPAIQVIAMSGAFSGNSVPPGVAADAFYEKGANPGALLQIVERIICQKRPPTAHHPDTPPIWIPKNGHDSSGEEYVTIACPECLRTFPQVFNDTSCLARETTCIYCRSLVCYAIVQSPKIQSRQHFRNPRVDLPTLSSGTT